MTSEPVHGVLAGAAITSPYWLDAVSSVSQISAILLPILGALWLIVQISVKLLDALRDTKDGPE